MVPPRMKNRWNSERNLILYTAWSRSLACLENIVHRSGEALAANYSCMCIEVPDDISSEEIDMKSMSENWKSAEGTECRMFGDAWAMSLKSAVLKVPSSLIEEEFNYLLNVHHPDFKKIRLIKKIPFVFDARLRIRS